MDEKLEQYSAEKLARAEKREQERFNANTLLDRTIELIPIIKLKLHQLQRRTR